MTHWAAERTIDVIRDSKPERPFFVLMSVFDPHNPYEGYPLEAAEAVDPSKIPGPRPETAEGEPAPIEREREGSYLLAVHEALDGLALEAPRAAELVKLRYFVGLTMEEAAVALGMGKRSAEALWTFARSWLHRAIRNSGNPG